MAQGRYTGNWAGKIEHLIDGETKDLRQDIEEALQTVAQDVAGVTQKLQMLEREPKVGSQEKKFSSITQTVRELQEGLRKVNGSITTLTSQLPRPESKKPFDSSGILSQLSTNAKEHRQILQALRTMREQSERTKGIAVQSVRQVTNIQTKINHKVSAKDMYVQCLNLAMSGVVVPLINMQDKALVEAAPVTGVLGAAALNAASAGDVESYVDVDFYLAANKAGLTDPLDYPIHVGWPVGLAEGVAFDLTSVYTAIATGTGADAVLTQASDGGAIIFGDGLVRVRATMPVDAGATKTYEDGDTQSVKIDFTTVAKVLPILSNIDPVTITWTIGA